MDDLTHQGDDREMPEPEATFAEEAAEGLWLRIRAAVLVSQRLERFVF